MELSVRELDLPSAVTKIPEDGVDPYRMVNLPIPHLTIQHQLTLLTTCAIGSSA